MLRQNIPLLPQLNSSRPARHIRGFVTILPQQVRNLGRNLYEHIKRIRRFKIGNIWASLRPPIRAFVKIRANSWLLFVVDV
jgi:hypothetical protein